MNNTIQFHQYIDHNMYTWCSMEDFTQVSLVISTKSKCPREVYI